jgi:hypothetical protein
MASIPASPLFYRSFLNGRHVGGCLVQSFHTVTYLPRVEPKHSADLASVERRMRGNYSLPVVDAGNPCRRVKRGPRLASAQQLPTLPRRAPAGVRQPRAQGSGSRHDLMAGSRRLNGSVAVASAGRVGALYPGCGR